MKGVPNNQIVNDRDFCQTQVITKYIVIVMCCSIASITIINGHGRQLLIQITSLR